MRDDTLEKLRDIYNDLVDMDEPEDEPLASLRNFIDIIIEDEERTRREAAEAQP